MKYHIWTEGCQMNVADSQRVGSSLEHLGYTLTETIEEADVIVLNTCVVRQSAEEKAMGRVTSLAPLKKKNPNLIINLMGCMVGVRGAEKLRERLPFVDVFSPPSDPGPLISLLTQGEVHSLENAETTRRFLMMDDELILPVAEQGKLVSAHVPIVYGCSHACTFCIIPSKRGGERSRPVGDIVGEVRSLARQGVKEITLLGQIVDRYGKDIPDGPNLAALLRVLHEVDGIERIRFLTSHPNYFEDDLIHAIAELPRVMPHIELPIQAGDDEVLVNMKRGYTQQQYRDLIAKIRTHIPDCSIATDIIVGFPGETEEQFMETYRVLSDLKLDVAHLARYSLREGTVATRRMDDNVPEEDKLRRLHILDDLQEKIVAEINKKYLGEKVDVLFENKVKGRWRGRTPTNKIVFVESEDDLMGKVLPVTVTWTGPWSMQAVLQKQPL
ncbi:MAG: tRNA (N6-isopentenyl adenosine(37)-C2)-methylthiotransferase MiaB [Anaerolineales bacterium]|uniref:tRNA (N6-isopentenyl adenosine(37)-C2)-methylthiotransferase MiaB n=1 Tax=Candidatus Villigracilis proximus TaxID=3140683 RepID=UPI0031370200|nr:tRNA (N6-isopentenyl adenosine(37)-C2)-methylthiotransferase MiaB [Anaerolineales bacterium]